MNRRSFLASLIATAALDPERLLWVPGAKRIFIPAESVIGPETTRLWINDVDLSGYLKHVGITMQRDVIEDAYADGRRIFSPGLATLSAQADFIASPKLNHLLKEIGTEDVKVSIRWPEGPIYTMSGSLSAYAYPTAFSEDGDVSAVIHGRWQPVSEQSPRRH